MKLFNQKTLSMAVATAMTLATVTGAQANNVSHSAHMLESANPMSFSFALNKIKGSAEQLKQAHQAVSATSNEYWFSVTGKQLNAGIDVHTTSKGALIKVSRAGSGDQQKGEQLDGKALTLLDGKRANVAGKVIGEDDLNATGIFAASSAIKMDSTVNPGTFKLGYNQKLAGDSQFVIHVKEKYSANLLKIETSKQAYVAGENLTFDAMMLAGDATLTMDSVEAFIMSPSGQKFKATTTTGKNGLATINARQFVKGAQIEAPINGLYELHLTAKANNKGMQIQRRGKIAFAMAEQTATMAPVKAAVSSKQTQFALNVNEAGRFEVRGVLYGHDKKGQLQPIMETHAAETFKTGKQLLTMEFDQKILKQSGLSAPFELKNVRLYDQSRMSRL